MPTVLVKVFHKLPEMAIKNSQSAAVQQNKMKENCCVGCIMFWVYIIAKHSKDKPVQKNILPCQQQDLTSEIAPAQATFSASML